MSGGITYEHAATILGCHISNVAKLVAKGELLVRLARQHPDADVPRP